MGETMTVRTSRSGVRRSLALAALTPILGLTACSGGDDQAQDSSSASSSSDGHYTEDTVIPAMQEALGDETSARVQVHLTGQAELSVDGHMAMTDSFEDGEMELTVEAQGQSLDLRMVDGLIYVSGPPATPAGKWVSFDTQDPKDPLAQQFAQLAKSGDLTSTFDAFKAGLEKVEYVGQDEIDGDTTGHYVFTVDSAEAAKAQDQPAIPGAPEQLTYDVWLTQDDLMRRVSFDIASVNAVVDATEWGEPVDVEAPAKSDIVERPTP
jgi:hypothetical protein